MAANNNRRNNMMVPEILRTVIRGHALPEELEVSEEGMFYEHDLQTNENKRRQCRRPIIPTRGNCTQCFDSGPVGCYCVNGCMSNGPVNVAVNRETNLNRTMATERNEEAGPPRRLRYAIMVEGSTGRLINARVVSESCGEGRHQTVPKNARIPRANVITYAELDESDVVLLTVRSVLNMHVPQTANADGDEDDEDEDDEEDEEE